MIRLTIPSIDQSDLDTVRNVLETGYLIQGRHVAEFESAVANYVGCKYAIAVSSCTAALHLSLLALDVKPGDLVVVTAYSWIATANVIELCGAQPIFVDIDAATFNIDVEQLASTLDRLMSTRETANRVKAIMPVHTFGQVADMASIGRIAEQYEIPVIEDAACALGAARDGRYAGTSGLGCFSFHPRKAITTGEGGMVTTNDPDAAGRLRSLRNHGADPDAGIVDFIRPGFNYRLTEFQAALGVTQMRKLDRIIRARRNRARLYDSLIDQTQFQVPYVPEGSEPVYQSYVILIPHGVERKRIIEEMGARGIQTTIGTYHMPMTSFFRRTYGFRTGDFPVVDDVFARSLTLPLHEFLTATEQERVVSELSAVLATL